MEDTAHLKAFFAGLDPGPISEEDREKLVDVLSSCWNCLEGGHDTSMGPHKLFRMEEPKWDPPLLTFTLERHGRTAIGSTRADLQSWAVNIDQLTAGSAIYGHRQLEKMDSPYRKEDARKDAKDMVQAMLTGADHQALLRRGPVIAIQPQHMRHLSGYSQTLYGRVKKVREAFSEEIAPHLSRFVLTTYGNRLAYEDLEFSVNINKADRDSLLYLSGVGPKTADRIIDGRPWNSLDELLNLPRFGKKNLAQIKEQGFATVE